MVVMVVWAAPPSTGPVIKQGARSRMVRFCCVSNSSHHDGENRNRKAGPDLLENQRARGTSHRYGITTGCFKLIPHDVDGRPFCFFSFKTHSLLFSLSPSLLCCSFHETEEDGTERLHSEARHKLLRLQAVSTI